MKRLLAFLMLAGLVALLITQVPLWLAMIHTDPSPPPTPELREDAQVDAFLDETLPLVGAKLLLARDERNGVVRSTWQLAYGRSASDLILELRRRGAELGIDVHPVEIDSPDRVLQVFGRRDLVHEILLVSAPPNPSPPGFNPNPQERPLVSLILTGLGQREADHIVELPVPVTIAVRPYQPFSLLIAQQSVHHWHEVVVDFSQNRTSTGSPSDAFKALPFASGVRIEELPRDELPAIPLGILLHSSFVKIPEDPPLRALMTHDAGRLGLETARARALFDAETTGVGVLSVPHDHPQIEVVIKWALDAEDEGYRLVLASEAARERDFRGTEEEAEDG